MRTPTYKDAKVGNGLSFKLPVPLRVVDVKEVKVFDDGITSNKLVDRVEKPGRETDGEKFHFQLIGYVPPASRDWQVGLGLSIAGGVVLLLAVVKFMRAQVI